MLYQFNIKGAASRAKFNEGKSTERILDMLQEPIAKTPAEIRKMMDQVFHKRNKR